MQWEVWARSAPTALWLLRCWERVAVPAFGWGWWAVLGCVGLRWAALVLWAVLCCLVIAKRMTATRLTSNQPTAAPAPDHCPVDPEQMAGAHLNSCSFRLEPPPPDGPLCLLGRPMGRLTVGQASRLQREDGLHALLEALLPPGALLDVLQLEHCQLSPPGTLQGVALLARPSALHLHYCKEGDQGGLGQAALQAILGQASGCCALELYGRLGSEGAPGATTLPPALANTRGVKWLCLRRNYLEDLPKGPWLAGEQLQVQHG